MPHAMLCRVVRLQFRLQTFFTSRCPLARQSGRTRQEALRPLLTQSGREQLLSSLPQSSRAGFDVRY
jgi:hypothetical protein